MCHDMTHDTYMSNLANAMVALLALEADKIKTPKSRQTAKRLRELLVARGAELKAVDEPKIRLPKMSKGMVPEKAFAEIAKRDRKNRKPA
jgi:hypothetical protein